MRLWGIMNLILKKIGEYFLENAERKEQKRVTGRVLSGVGGLYTVLTEDGRTLSCSARGSLRFARISPYPGDTVTVAEEDSGRHAIESIMPRKNFFGKPPAANIDKLFITVAAASPSPSYITVDKLICAAEYYNTVSVIVVTKCELDPKKAEKIKNVYEKSGYSVFLTSSAEKLGIDELKSFISSEIKNCTAVFAGESGVGKSSLMNTLFPSLSLVTGAVSRKISRGKHTTRAVTLYPVSDDISAEGAFLADTPGFGIFDLSTIDDLTKDEVPELFPEFRPYISECRYRKCTHLREEGCAVIDAVNNGMIAPQRHESYVTVYEEIKKLRPWQTSKTKK